MLTTEELKQIRRISLQAGRRVDSLFAGGYRSAFRGRGMEFEEVRPYVPGDDVRHIDWNVTARSADEVFVKEFHEERELTLMLALDCSGSMAFGSETDKRLQMARLAGGLAYAAIRNDDRVGLCVFTDQIELFVPPRKSRGHAWRVIREVFEHRPARAGTDVMGAAEHLGKVLKRRAVVCFISDFLVYQDTRRAMASLASRHRVHGFVLHDPLEARPPRGSGLVEVVDSETGQGRLVELSSFRGALGVDARVAMLRRAGTYASAVSTTQDPFRVLLSHFERVAHR
ncbi:MAG TPA: DUF58 domain-containing protein [Myxococcota bacterium]|nr:DUF58 domain-containing protein [Myxococcota bacterium]